MGYVSNSLFHDKQFSLNLNSAYHMPLLYKIHLVSVERRFERFVTYAV